MPTEPVVLPDQVRRQLEEAEALQRAFMAEQGLGDTTQPEEGEDTTQPEEGEDTIQPGEGEEQIQPGEGEEVQEPEPEPDPWETRYRTLQGKYDREIGGLRSENNQLQGRLERLERQLAGGAGTAQPNGDRPAPATPSRRKRITDKDVADLGPELYDLMKKTVQDEVEPELQSLKVENAQLKNQLGQVSTTVSKARTGNFVHDLSAIEPGWTDLNEDPDFIDWLDQPDRYARVPRQQLLDARVKELDSEGAAVFFQDYLAERGQAAQSTATPAPARQNSAPRGNRVRLETLASPGARAGTSTATQTQRGHAWTPSEIQKFYSEKRQGLFKGREAEADQIERDIFAAQRDGRVQPG
jgi:hypothetical protein